MDFCVIIPTFNEAPLLSRCVNAVRASHQFAISPGKHERVSARLRFIVSDGGSTDGTQDTAIALGCEVLGQAPGSGRGRGFQLAFATDYVMCQGGSSSLHEEAKTATCNDEQSPRMQRDMVDDGSTVLLFLHADCIVDPSALAALAHVFSPALPEPRRSCHAESHDELELAAATEMSEPISELAGCDIATLRLKYTLPLGASTLRQSFFRCCESWCFHGDGLWRSFGDQAIAITPRAMRIIGGFPRWPLFEDVELFRRARRAAATSKQATTRKWGWLRDRRSTRERCPGGRKTVDLFRLKKIVKVNVPIMASTRRFDQHGDFRYAAKCWFLVSMFASGASPEWLSQQYGERRPR